MKRFFSIALTLALLCSGLAIAQTSTQPTDKRGIVEYAELCMKRIDIAVKDGYTKPSDMYIPDIKAMNFNDDEFFVSTVCGSAQVDKTDLTVNKAFISLITYDPDGETGKQLIDHYAMAIAAFTALEMNDLDADNIEWNYQYLGGQYADVIMQYTPDMGNIVTLAISDANLAKILNNEMVKVYSGNYDYYAMAVEAENGNINIELYAVAR